MICEKNFLEIELFHKLNVYFSFKIYFVCTCKLVKYY
jgi:hypothetical protein